MCPALYPLSHGGTPDTHRLNSEGSDTEYLIVSSQPPTGYYVDGVTACPVSRASAGFTEYLIVSNLECKGDSELLRSDCLPPPHLGDTFGHPRTPNDHPVDGVTHICFRMNISTRSYLSHVKSPHLRHVKYRA